jgi:hypothetical protein
MTQLSWNLLNDENKTVWNEMNFEADFEQFISDLPNNYNKPSDNCSAEI